jgi:hypothetical protein
MDLQTAQLLEAVVVRLPHLKAFARMNPRKQGQFLSGRRILRGRCHSRAKSMLHLLARPFSRGQRRCLLSFLRWICVSEQISFRAQQESLAVCLWLSGVALEHLSACEGTPAALSCKLWLNRTD